ncbi:MAG: hypothetical protein DMG37_09395 [Acidobacteria bacterium]|nr:MAG: hypothetical protein DMG37_09395 [Acidobacteriota bacterium]
MNSAIEIHDSVIDAITNVDGKAVLYSSSVYIHKSLGKPGVDPGTGWVQRAKLTIVDAIILTLFPGELLGGYLRLGDSIFDNEIPIPLNFRGDTEIRLESWNDQIILVFGRGAELELIDEPTYVEDFGPE